ncbi:unnamed protein product, partial [Ectocarpus sp. 12 AP-2014]
YENDNVEVDPSYRGCFADTADNRVFHQTTSDFDLTTEHCGLLCSIEGFLSTACSIRFSAGAVTTTPSTPPTATACATCPAGATPTTCAEGPTAWTSTRSTRRTSGASRTLPTAAFSCGRLPLTT